MYIKKLFNPYMGLPREIYILFISKIINAMGSFVMPLLTLILTEKIGLSNGKAGYYISISGILYIPALIIGGKLADVCGRKVIIAVFNIVGATLYIIAGFLRPSITMVYLIMIAGACFTATGPAHDSLVADITNPANRKSAYSLLYMGWNTGYAVGPTIGGFLFKDHLPLVFIGDATTALIALCLIIIFVKETIHIKDEGIVANERASEKSEEGSIVSVILKRPILIFFALILFCYNFVYSQWSFMLPIQVVDVFKDAGAKYFGMMASLNGLVVMFFTPVITKMTEKINELMRAVLGGILYTVGFGMLGFVNLLPFFFLSTFIFTLGEVILAISTSPFIANRTPSSHRGRMNAVLQIIMGAGYMIGPLVMGNVLNYVEVKPAWMILGAFVSFATLLMYGLEKYDERKNVELSQC